MRLRQTAALTAATALAVLIPTADAHAAAIACGGSVSTQGIAANGCISAEKFKEGKVFFRDIKAHTVITNTRANASYVEYEAFLHVMRRRRRLDEDGQRPHPRPAPLDRRPHRNCQLHPRLLRRQREDHRPCPRPAAWQAPGATGRAPPPPSARPDLPCQRPALHGQEERGVRRFRRVNPPSRRPAPERGARRLRSRPARSP